MSGSAIAIGEKLHIITRRLFDGDLRRHFAGEVTAVSGELCEVRGYAFVFNPGVNRYDKRPELRTRLFSVGHDGLIVNKIPRETSITALDYRSVEKGVVVTDGGTFSLDINEFGTSR